MLTTLRLFVASLLLVQLIGCAVLAVADAAVSAVATTAKITVKAVGAVAGAVIPDGEEKKAVPEK